MKNSSAHAACELGHSSTDDAELISSCTTEWNRCSWKTNVVNEQTAGAWDNKIGANLCALMIDEIVEVEKNNKGRQNRRWNIEMKKKSVCGTFIVHRARTWHFFLSRNKFSKRDEHEQWLARSTYRNECCVVSKREYVKMEENWISHGEHGELMT